MTAGRVEKVPGVGESTGGLEYGYLMSSSGGAPFHSVPVVAREGWEAGELLSYAFKYRQGGNSS